MLGVGILLLGLNSGSAQLMKQKISVIGGSGFVGTNLCSALEKSQVDFEIIDLKKSNKFSNKSKIADIRDIDSLRKSVTGDIVINLAAVHRDDVGDLSEYTRTNVEGAANLTQICIEKGICKIIFTSSVAVYGFTTKPTGENGQINPFNEYGRSKFAAEEVFRSWGQKAGRHLVIIRPTVIFGEGNRGNVYNLLNQIASRKFLMIGNGKNHKSLAFIDNVVAFLQGCIQTDQTYALYNYVDTPDLTMDELIKHVRLKLFGTSTVGFRIPRWLGVLVGHVADVLSKLLFQKLRVSALRIKKFTSSSHFTSAKSQLDNFRPPYNLIEGINKTIESEFISPDPEREVFFTE